MSLERAITARWEVEVGDDALELRGKGEKGLSVGKGTVIRAGEV